MKCYVGLGSNLGDKTANLERAGQALQRIVHAPIRVSPVYRTPAVIPLGGPECWRIPFHNAVAELEFSGSPIELLLELKEIEKAMGREPAARWAPRIIDLDILVFGDEIVRNDELKVPHPELWDRAFVVDPLKDLAPSLRIAGRSGSVLSRARQLPGHAPLWMGILNVTPDSFSDGGSLQDPSALERKLETFDEAGISIFDVGAESTRPGAIPLTAEVEWARLKPALELIKARYRNRLFRPRLSVDTRHADVALRAVEMGIDCINDVSGGADPGMKRLLQDCRCEYVLMHSLSVPADPRETLAAATDPVESVLEWCEKRLEDLASSGIDLDRVIFDPGIGFGKTAQQSLRLMARIEEFYKFPVRILVGHSRKSFIKNFSDRSAGDRDWESVGLSLQMASRGVDILRVHEPQFHTRAHRAYQEVSAWNQ